MEVAGVKHPRGGILPPLEFELKTSKAMVTPAIAGFINNLS